MSYLLVHTYLYTRYGFDNCWFTVSYMSDCTNVDGSLSADHFRCQRSNSSTFYNEKKSASIAECTTHTKILVDLVQLRISRPTPTQQNGLRVSLPTMTVSTCRCWNLESFSNIELQISQNDFFGSTQISNHYNSIITMTTLLLPGPPSSLQSSWCWKGL